MTEQTDSPAWCVRRFGGRTTDVWRTIYSGSEAQARERYTREAAALRQGVVQLIAPDGRVAAQTSAPRLRTRW